MVTIAKTKQPVRMPRFGHRVDKTDPILRGCVGWWPLNDGAGTKAVDLSANGNDGTLSGSVTWDVGEKGTEANFAGGQIGLGTGTSGLGLSSTDTATVSFWLKRTTIGASILGTAFGNPDSGGSSDIALMPTKGEFGTYNWFDIAKNVTQRRITGVPYTNYEYNHFAVIFNGTNASLYVDGSLYTTITTLPSGNFSATHGNLEIGGSSLGSLDIKGDIQNVRVYNRALTATEVSRLYNEPWAGLEPLSPFSFFSGLSQIYAYYSAAFLQRLG